MAVHIQPYFPEPVEVGKNAASERYLVRLTFIRATMAGHVLSVVAVLAAALFFEPVMSAELAAAVFFGCLLALTVFRRILDGGPQDNLSSLLLMAPTVWSLGTLVRLVSDSGSPVWILGAGYLFANVYGAVCGKDFSFVGQFVLTTVALITLLVAVSFLTALTWSDAVLWGTATLVYVLFYVYDLAALLSRRRLGEEPSAVADLYRDLLNFITYSVRVVLHWRRFRDI